MEIAFHSRSPTMTQAFPTLGERIESFLSHSRALQLQPSIYPLDLCPVMSWCAGFKLCRVESMQESINGAADHFAYIFGRSSNRPPFVISLDSRPRGDGALSLDRGSAQGFFLLDGSFPFPAVALVLLWVSQRETGS